MAGKSTRRRSSSSHRFEPLESRDLLTADGVTPLFLELPASHDDELGHGAGVGVTNEAPVLSPAGPSADTDEDTPVTMALNSIINAAGSTMVTDENPDDPVGGVVITGTDGFRPFEYSLDGGTTFNEIIAVSQNSALALPEDAILQFRPEDLSGMATLTYAAWDQTSGTPGSLVEASFRGDERAFSVALDTFTLNVSEINDEPMAEADTALVGEDDSVIIDILTNDTAGPEEEDQVLTVSMLSASNGQVTLNVDQTLTYVPNDNFFGSDTISYTITDDGTTDGVSDPKADQGSVSVTIEPMIDPPFANNETFEVEENLPAETTIGSVAFTALDWPNSEPPLSYEIVDGDPNGVFSINADGTIQVANARLLDYEATQSFTLTIEANDTISTGSTMVTINLTDVDEIPPEIVSLRIASSNWSPAFLEEVGPNGYEIPIGTGLTQPLPWAGLDELTIEFSEPMSPVSADDIGLFGVQTLSYLPMISSFEHLPDSNIVKLQLSTPIDPDRLRLTAVGSMTDLIGNEIDLSNFGTSLNSGVEHGRIDVDDSSTLTVTRIGGSSNFSVPTDFGNGGDFIVKFGTDVDHQNGVMITTVRENGRRATSASERTDSLRTNGQAWFDIHAGTYFIPTNSYTGSEANVDTAAAFFPFDSFLGGAGYTAAYNEIPTNGGGIVELVGSDDISLTSSDRAKLSTEASGVFKLDLSAIRPNASENGILLVSGGKNEDNFALSQANDDEEKTFTIYVKDNGSSGATFEQDPFAFVYIDDTYEDITFGRVVGDGDAATNAENFAVLGGNAIINDGGTGLWHLTIPGQSDSTGTLIVSPAGGTTWNRDNIVSYEFDQQNGYWVIESRDLVNSSTSPPLQNINGEDAFSFAFMPDSPPVRHQVDFNILIGDTNRSGGVSVDDVAGIRSSLGSAIGDASYSLFADLNGSGSVAVNDLGALRINLGNTLPEDPSAVAAVASDFNPAFPHFEFADAAARRNRVVDHIFGEGQAQQADLEHDQFVPQVTLIQRISMG